MTANGIMTCSMAKEKKLGQKVQNTLVNTSWARRMVLVDTTGKQEVSIMVNG